MTKSAADLEKGELGIIKELSVEDGLQRQRLMDLGYLPDTKIKCYAKTYGNAAYVVRESIFAIRDEDAQKIILI